MNAIYRKACKHLSADPVLAPVIARVGRCTLQPRAEKPLAMLVRCVISQQISGKAAEAINSRLAERIRNRYTPTTLASLSEADYRACGISGPKQRAIRGILDHIASNRGFLKSLPHLDNLSFIRAVTAIKGIGPWSADMMLIFAYGRLDILPVGDYGVRVAAQKLYGLAELPKPVTLENIAEPWRPYRTIGSWYLWQYLSLK